MGRIKLIGVDLDGTVLDNEKRISPENERVFAECRRRGIHVVPVTGRPYSGLYEEYKRALGCRYSINTNGAAVIDVETDSRLFSHGIAGEKALELMDILARFDCYYGIFYRGYGYLTPERYFFELDKYAGTPLHTYIKASRKTTDDQRGFINSIGCCDNIYVIASSLAERERIRAEISPVEDIFFTCSSSDDVEIGGNCSKGSSLTELAALLDIEPGEIMAIGDSANDLKMLEAAGTAVAMGNADPLVKAAADYVTDTCERDGVAKIIESLVF